MLAGMTGDRLVVLSWAPVEDLVARFVVELGQGRCPITGERLAAGRRPVAVAHLTDSVDARTVVDAERDATSSGVLVVTLAPELYANPMASTLVQGQLDRYRDAHARFDRDTDPPTISGLRPVVVFATPSPKRRDVSGWRYWPENTLGARAHELDRDAWSFELLREPRGEAPAIPLHRTVRLP